MAESPKESSLERAARVLASGGCVVYPTETFYALGASIANPQALERINAIKGRPRSKPLPVIIGDMNQLAMVLGPQAYSRPDYLTALALMVTFWPGSLSVIVPARPDLPAPIKDGQGGVSLRLTPHPQARDLCLRVGTPLAATSANVSGDPAVSSLEGLSPAVCMGADYVMPGDPEPGGGMASTVVRPLAGRQVIIYRQGAVSVEDIVAAGFALSGEM